MYHFWKKGQASQSDYKDIVRLSGEENRKAKDQLKFNLATAVKGKNKFLYKYISNRVKGEGKSPSFTQCRVKYSRG